MVNPERPAMERYRIHDVPAVREALDVTRAGRRLSPVVEPFVRLSKAHDWDTARPPRSGPGARRRNEKWPASAAAADHRATETAIESAMAATAVRLLNIGLS